MEVQIDRRWVLALVGAIAIGVVAVLARGPGAEAAKAVDRAADGLTGNQAVREGEELKRQLRSITEDWKERIRSAGE